MDQQTRLLAVSLEDLSCVTLQFETMGKVALGPIAMTARPASRPQPDISAAQANLNISYHFNS